MKRAPEPLPRKKEYPVRGLFKFCHGPREHERVPIETPKRPEKRHFSSLEGRLHGCLDGGLPVGCLLPGPFLPGTYQVALYPGGQRDVIVLAALPERPKHVAAVGKIRGGSAGLLEHAVKAGASLCLRFYGCTQARIRTRRLYQACPLSP